MALYFLVYDIFPVLPQWRLTAESIIDSEIQPDSKSKSSLKARVLALTFKKDTRINTS